jgi:hypothetical protein
VQHCPCARVPMVLGAHCAVLGVQWGLSFLSPTPPPLFPHLPPSFGTLTGMSNRSFDRFSTSREATSGFRAMWVLVGLVTTEQGGADVSTPPFGPFGYGGYSPGCGIRFGACVGWPPGCLVGAGTRLGAATVTGAVALQQQEWGRRRRCHRRHLRLVPFSCVRAS